jgi:hypothetical protein
VSEYLGRLVDRAIGLPGAARPRLAPVFPLGRAAEEAPPAAEEPESVIPVDAESAPAVERPVARPAAPAAPRVRPTWKRRAAPATDGIEQPPSTVPPVHGPQPVMRHTAVLAEPPEPAGRQAKVTPRRAGEDARPRAAQPVAVEPRPRHDDPALVLRRVPEPHRAPSIEVRIGRVEVRRPPEPEPVEWQSPPALQPPSSTGFSDLAASRRYVDRSWRS